jgi:hypothetical protein
MEIKPETLSNWIKFIRFHPDLAERFMDCFWESQLVSKSNLLYALERKKHLGNVYIFGGWYGILTQLLLDSYNHTTKSIFSIDIDPTCEWIINDTIKQDNVFAITHDMASFDYPITPNTVINTCTEHVTQEHYDIWWDKVPKGTLYVLQGNNFWDDPEHIRCAVDINDFKQINKVSDCDVEFQFPCPGPKDDFLRFMVMGIK